MKSEHLQSLLIDQALGELSEETSTLLEAYLDQCPELREEAERTRRAVAVTELVVQSLPYIEEPKPRRRTVAFPVLGQRWLLSSGPLRIAAALVVLGSAAGIGFFAGKGSSASRSPGEATAQLNRPASPSPWARYRIDDSAPLAQALPAVQTSDLRP